MKDFTDKQIFSLIKKVVAEYYQVDDISIKSRKRELVFPRQVIYYFANKMTRIPLRILGESYSQDHSTVSHACKTIENLMEVTPSISSDIAKIQEQIKNITDERKDKINQKTQDIDTINERMRQALEFISQTIGREIKRGDRVVLHLSENGALEGYALGAFHGEAEAEHSLPL